MNEVKRFVRLLWGSSHNKRLGMVWFNEYERLTHHSWQLTTGWQRTSYPQRR